MKSRFGILRKAVTLTLMAVMLIAVMPVLSVPAFTSEAGAITATGTINDSDVNLREHASTSSESVAVLSKNKKVTIQREVFKTEDSTKAVDRWYFVTVDKKSGYVRSDLVSNISWSNTAAVSTDELNYRSGPSKSFSKIGTAGAGASVSLLLPAKLAGYSSMWYRAVVDGKTVYVNADYIKLGKSLFITKTAKELSGKSDVAKALLASPTRAGKARVVYTFTSSNCESMFPIHGTKNAKVPQGLAFTGSEYYVLYGMAAGQSIVTYSAKGDRLRESEFSFCIGHPNGITYDPVTNMCYVFKGNTKSIFTWSPVTRKFGKSQTPYSSSGVAYDSETNRIYASSRTGIRIYSPDGSFNHKDLFSRCDHGIFHYTQDCGAGDGFIFHGISGANKKTTNYIDVYRASDIAYLGSIKVDLGEIESIVVGNDGFVRLLINTLGDDTDYIWKTPLNVNELK